MKKNCLVILYSSFFLALFSSCVKYTDITTPDNFAVTTPKQTYKVGDSVIFSFNSGPDQIIFYSGEPGKNYANKDRTQQ